MKYFFDYYNFEYQNYGETLINISKEENKSRLIVDNNGLRYAGKYETLVQKIKGLLGFENKTDLVKVNAELLKMLYYGQTHGYMENHEVKKAFNVLVHHLKSKNRKVSRAVLDCFNAINLNPKTDQGKEARLLVMREAIKSYHSRHQFRLKDAFWTQLFQERKPHPVNPPINFGDTYRNLAYQAKQYKNYTAAWTYYKKAASFKNNNAVFNSGFLHSIIALSNANYPQDAVPLIKELADIALKNNEYEQAATAFRIIARYDSSGENQLCLARALKGLKKYDECLALFKKYGDPQEYIRLVKEIAGYYENSGDHSMFEAEIERFYLQADNFLHDIDINARARIIGKLSALKWKKEKKSLLMSIVQAVKGNNDKSKSRDVIVERLFTLLEEIKNLTNRGMIASETGENLVSIGKLLMDTYPQEAYRCLKVAYKLEPKVCRDEFFNLSIKLEKYHQALSIDFAKCRPHAAQMVQYYIGRSEFQKAYQIILQIPTPNPKYKNLVKLEEYFTDLKRQEYDLGKKFEKEKNYDAALKNFQAALKNAENAFRISPTYNNRDEISQMHRKAGNALVALDDLDLAKENYRMSLDAEIEFDQYLRDSILDLAEKYLAKADKYIGICLEGKDVFEEASRKVHQNNPFVVEASNKALAALQHGIDSIESSIKTKHRNKINKDVLGNLTRLLAKLYYKKGDILDYFELPGRLEAFRSAVEYNDNNVFYQLRLRDLYALSDNKSEADIIWEKIQKIGYEGIGIVWWHYSEEQFLKERIQSAELDIHAYKVDLK